MRNLFYLFVRYGGFVSFLLLEALCIYLIINFNEKQNRIFLHSANVISGTVAEQFDNLADFLRLQEERDSLAANNARLLAMLGISRFDIALKADTVVNRQDTQRYRYVAAEVINNSTRKSRNFLTLSRGSLHGIKPRMGVIDERGVVGIVRNTSPHFSLVMSVLHPQMRISVRHASSNHEGSLQWEAPLGPDQVNVLYIPRTAPLNSGDTLLTSGYSTHFPPGLPVAVVDTFVVKPGGSTWEVKARLLNDLRNSRYVYVVDDLLAEEQLQLESANE